MLARKSLEQRMTFYLPCKPNFCTKNHFPIKAQFISYARDARMQLPFQITLQIDEPNGGVWVIRTSVSAGILDQAYCISCPLAV